MTSLKALCIIPARGGSKRLPRKNIADFYGQPMIAYSIEAALSSECFERVIVSSDDEEILAIASKYGAEPVRREPALASDTARVSAVLLAHLDQAETAGQSYDIISCLFPCAPLRHADDVRKVVGFIQPGLCDFSIAVTTYDLPPHQALKLEKTGDLSPMWPDLVDMRDEEVGQLVVDNGSTYAATVSAFRRQKNFYGKPLRGHMMERERSVDINTSTDLEICRLHYANIFQNKR